jgi:hypothetical protein
MVTGTTAYPIRIPGGLDAPFALAVRMRRELRVPMED